MSENDPSEETLIDESVELEEVTLEEIKANLPKVFMNPSKDEPDVSFDFKLNEIEKVKIAKNRKTKVGTADMIVLYSEPVINCFRNAYLQLCDFITKNKIKLPAMIRYVTREGADFNTKYIFEKV